jgi:4-amino-4-deoxy-L-arabinose transferase-like glycosyltransferase
MNRYQKYIPFLIGCFALLCFLPFLGSVHLFDWDEINFAESAREMLVSGDYLTVQINYQPFWEKPPLFIWFQLASIKLFGVNEFAARFPNAIGGMVTLLFLYFVGKRSSNYKFGILWSISFGASVLPFLYFKSGIIDPWFNLFIFSGIYFAYRYFTFVARLKYVLLAAGLIGLAVLTKGPVGVLLFGLAIGVYILLKKFKVQFHWSHLLIFILVFSVVGGFWFLLQLAQGNMQVLKDFITYQIRLFQTKDAGHGGFLFYHFVVVFVGMFPASVFALKAFFKNNKIALLPDLLLLSKTIFWVVLILFTLVSTKIVHYSSLAYFPVSFFSAWVLYQMVEQKLLVKKWMLRLYTFMAFLFIIALASLPIIDANKDAIIASGLIKDAFATANLQAKVSWPFWTYLPGVILLVSTIAAWIFYRKKRVLGIVFSIFIANILFVFLTMMLIVPRIEQYSQRAAINFMQSIRHKDAYIFSDGYKSYAPYFYADVKPFENTNAYNLSWLKTGDIDKPVYCILKNTHEEKFFEKNKQFIKIDEKNGFILAIRNPFNEQK